MDLYKGYKAGEPCEFVGVRVDGNHIMEAGCAKAYIAMREAALTQGVELVINSAFRTTEQQAALYAKFQAGGPRASRPGYSKHQSGVAVDLESGGGHNAAFKWLTANAASYGFKRTVPAEPWHWEYLGKRLGG